LRVVAKYVIKVIAPATNTSTGPGGKSSCSAITNPTAFPVRPSTTDHRIMDFNDVARLRAPNAGSNVIESTRSAPVTRIDDPIDTAINISKIAVNEPTRIPEHFASSRSNNKIESLRCVNATNNSTQIAIAIISARSCLRTASIEPHRISNAPFALTPLIERTRSAAAAEIVMRKLIEPASPPGFSESGARKSPVDTQAINAHNVGSIPTHKPIAVPNNAMCITAKRTVITSSPIMNTPMIGIAIPAMARAIADR